MVKCGVVALAVAVVSPAARGQDPGNLDLPLAALRWEPPEADGALRPVSSFAEDHPWTHIYSERNQGLSWWARVSLPTSLAALLCSGHGGAPLTIPACEHLRRAGVDVSLVGLDRLGKINRDLPWPATIELALAARCACERGFEQPLLFLREMDKLPPILAAELRRLEGKARRDPVRVPHAALWRSAMADAPTWPAAWISLRPPGTEFWPRFLAARRLALTQWVWLDWNRAAGSLPETTMHDAQSALEFAEEFAYEVARLCGLWRLDHLLVGLAADGEGWWARAVGEFDVARIEAELRRCEAQHGNATWRWPSCQVTVTDREITVASSPTPSGSSVPRDWPSRDEDCDFAAVVSGDLLALPGVTQGAFAHHAIAVWANESSAIEWWAQLRADRDPDATRKQVEAMGADAEAPWAELVRAGMVTTKGRALHWQTTTSWPVVWKAIAPAGAR